MSSAWASSFGLETPSIRMVWGSSALAASMASRARANLSVSIVSRLAHARDDRSVLLAAHHAHPRTGRGPLGDAVLPGALARAAEDQQVARRGCEAQRPPTALGPHQETARRTQREDGDDRRFSLAADPVAVPRHAVVAVAVEVGRDDREVGGVVLGQRVGHGRQGVGWVGPQLGCQPRLEHDLVVHAAMVRGPRSGCEHRLEQGVDAFDPPCNLVNPRPGAQLAATRSCELGVEGGGDMTHERRLPDQRHPFRLPTRWRTTVRRRGRRGRSGSVGVGRTQVDAEHQNAVLDGAIGVADDGKVLVIDLGLADELHPLLAGDRWERPPPHRLGAVAEALQHRLDVERVSHGPNRTGPRGARRPGAGSPAALASPDVGVAHRAGTIGAGGAAWLSPAVIGAGRPLAAAGLARRAARVDAWALRASAWCAATSRLARRNIASTALAAAGGSGARIFGGTPAGGTVARTVAGTALTRAGPGLAATAAAPASGRAAALAGSAPRRSGCTLAAGTRLLPRRAGTSWCRRWAGWRTGMVGRRRSDEGAARIARCVPVRVGGAPTSRARRAPVRGRTGAALPIGPGLPITLRPAVGAVVVAARRTGIVAEVESRACEQPVAPREQGDEQGDTTEAGDDHPDQPVLVVGAAAFRGRRRGGGGLLCALGAVAGDQQVGHRGERDALGDLGVDRFHGRGLVLLGPVVAAVTTRGFLLGRFRRWLLRGRRH